MSSPQPTPTPLPEPSIFGISVVTLFEIILIFAVAITLERIVTRYIKQFAKKTKLAPNVANNLSLSFRVVVLIGTILAISRIGGLSAEWILSISAIAGAAVGFASTKTLGNFIAGIFLLTARPYKVGDYVRIGLVEGIVQEMTINYTKVLTSANNMVSISNLQVLDRDITNYLYENKNKDLYCYTFEIGFDHTVSADKIVEIFDQVFKQHIQVLPKKPSYILTRSAAFERVYMVFLYVENPKDIFTLRPQIAEEVFQRWDAERAKLKK